MGAITLAASALAANASDQWFGYGAIAVLAGVIAFLFKLYHSRNVDTEKVMVAQAKEHAEELGKRDKAHAEEIGRRDAREAALRAECDALESTLRAEYEAKMHAEAREYADALRQIHIDNRTHGDGVRREFTEIMEVVASQANEGAKGVTLVLDKLYDHLAGARTSGPRTRHTKT